MLPIGGIMNLSKPINLYLDSANIPLEQIELIVETRDTRAAEFLFIQFMCAEQVFFQNVIFNMLSNYLFNKKSRLIAHDK